MKAIVKNFFSTLRRYSTSVALNAIGLSVAFTAFVIIMMQADYELRYDRFHAGAERIFRVEFVVEPGELVAIVPQPVLDEILSLSAHVEKYSLVDDDDHAAELDIVTAEGEKVMFRIPVAGVYPDFPEMFGFRMVEGTAASIDEPCTALIPESIAETVFPGQAGSRVGQAIGKYIVGGVYADLPSNSVIKNALYYRYDEKWGWSNFNFRGFVMLDSPDARAAVEEMVANNPVFMEQYADLEAAAIRLTPLPDLYYTTDVWYDYPDKGSRANTFTLLLVAILVIAIATINYVNFAAALAPMRMKSINTQKILGATRESLCAGLVAEAALISLASFLLSLLFVYAFGNSAAARYVTADMALEANTGLLLRTAILSILIGAAAGIIPALRMTSVPPIMAIKGSGGGPKGGRGYRSALTGIQFAISTALIVAALLVNMQNRFLNRFELGYETEHIAHFELSQRLVGVQDALAGELSGMGNVEGVAFADIEFPYHGTYSEWGRPFRGSEQITYQWIMVSWNFPEVMGISVSDGRTFLESDTEKQGAYIYNQAARKKYELNTGEWVSQDNGKGWGYGEIVGFVDDDVHVFPLRQAENPFGFYMCNENLLFKDLSHAYVRGAAGTPPSELVGSIKKAVEAASPGHPTPEVNFVDSMVDALYKKEHQLGALITLFSAMAIVIALTGVFGLVLFDTQYRRKEIGIRRVMGASAGGIIELIARRFMIILLVSFAIAVPAGWYFAEKWLSGFAYRISHYWWIFLPAVAAVALVTAVTVVIRSWRAASENPVNLIKTE